MSEVVPASAAHRNGPKSLVDGLEPLVAPARRVHPPATDPVRRIAIIEKRHLVRDCLHKCLSDTLDDEILSFPSLDRLSTMLESLRSEGSDLLVLYSIGNQFLDSRTTERMARLLDSRGRTRIAIISEREEMSMATAALEHGACGFLTFTMPLTLITEAVRLLNAGGLYIPANAALAASRKQDMSDTRSSCGLSGLTTRAQHV